LQRALASVPRSIHSLIQQRGLASIREFPRNLPVSSAKVQSWIKQSRDSRRTRPMLSDCGNSGLMVLILGITAPPFHSRRLDVCFYIENPFENVWMRCIFSLTHNPLSIARSGPLIAGRLPFKDSLGRSGPQACLRSKFLTLGLTLTRRMLPTTAKCERVVPRVRN
jgi:hypothetical protein